jgi:lipopolysaccharide exporter
MERDVTRDTPHAPGESRAGFAAKALRGLMWVASTGLGSRIVTLLSTLMLTRYVEPKDYGEVQNTYVVVWMVDLLTQLGIPSYIAGRADISKKHIAHATFFFHVFGFAGMLLCLLLAKPLGPHFGAPNMHLYMPGFVLGTLLQRVTTIPDRLLVRDLRFRAASAGRAGGEVVYAVSSLALAMAGTRLDFRLAGYPFVFGGGFAIVWGGIARGLFRIALMLKLVSVREWFAVLRPERQITREVAAFGVPITMAVLGGIGSRRWDNLAIGNLYGPSTAGIYNFAYNLADVPSQVVGESLGDVLAPSFARTEPAERSKELRRWVGFSALLCFPLGVGLSAVAASLRWMLREEWVSAIPMVLLLGSLSLTRPVINTVYAYLQVLGRTRTLMLLEWARAVGIVAAISVLGRALRAVSESHSEQWGPLLACVAVGVAHLASVLAYQVIAARAGGFPARQVITPLFRPLLACVPMVAAVLLVRLAIGPVESKALLILRLVVEILAGAVIYVGAAWLVARAMVKDFIDLIKTSILKRRSG